VQAETNEDTRSVPLSAIRVLLPVWGRRYAERFLEFLLPSLLAEGNLPALVAAAPTTFVLLTRARDRVLFERHPVFRELQGVCAVEIVEIDDLISDASGVVLTVAYLRGMRSIATDPRNICFFYLVSDYVLAEGSLRNVLGRISAGASAVLAGNFQGNQETIGPALERFRQGSALVVPPRELVRIGLDTMHAQSAAAVVGNQGLAARCNRLFWRIGESGLLGRFWLMHMIAIRPEVSDYIVAGPSDYAFVPEFCVSGRVERIVDSDDYMVLEVQNAAAAGTGLPSSAAAIAKSVSEWATKEHLANARQSVYFHSDASRPSGAVEAAAHAFVSAIEVEKKSLPKSSRYHPYWGRMLDYHRATAVRPVDQNTVTTLLGGGGQMWSNGSLRRLLLGRGSSVKLWHPRWADLAVLRRGITELDLSGQSLLVVGKVPYAALTLFSAAAAIEQIEIEELSHLADGTRFDRVVILARATPDAGAMAATTRLLMPGGRLLIGLGDFLADDAQPLPVFKLPEFAGFSTRLAIAVSAGRRRIAAQGAMMGLARTGRPIRMLGAAALTLPSVLMNLISLGRCSNAGATVSCMVVTLERVPAAVAVAEQQYLLPRRCSNTADLRQLAKSFS